MADARTYAVNRRTLRVGRVLLGTLIVTQGCRTSAGSRPSARATPAETAYRQFDAEAERLREALSIPGLSLAIVSSGRIVHSTGRGFADVKARTPATDSTPFEIASVSKTFAAEILLQAVEAGKLHLDDPMSRYASSYKGDSIKVRHVMSHTSSGSPGSTFQYNGNIFADLTDVAIAATGQRYRKLLVDRIIGPLGMTETSPGNDLRADQEPIAALIGRDHLLNAAKTMDRLARPYRLYGDEIVETRETQFGLSTANGMVSTIRDLAKFDRALDEHRLVSAETQKLAWTAQRNVAGKSLPYGLGWFVQPYGADTLVWHFGNLPDLYSSLLLKIPSRGLTLIMLANSDALSSPFFLGQGDVTRSAFACAFLRVVAQLSCDRRADSAVVAWRSAKRASARHEWPVTPSQLARVAGAYEVRPGTLVTFGVEDGRLVRRGNPDLLLFAETDTSFFAKSVDAAYRFEFDHAGRATAVVIDRNGQTTRAIRAPTATSEPVTTNVNMSLSDSLRAFVEKMGAMFHAGNAEGVIALYGDSTTYVHINNGLVQTWVQTVRTLRANAGVVSPAEFTGTPVIVVLDAQTAVATYTLHIDAVGGRPAQAGVWTGVLRREATGWKIVHSHASTRPAGT